MANSVILFGADGAPQPPQDILRRLRAVDPRLGMKYTKHVPETPWSVTLSWDENDPRRESVRNQTIAEANAVDIVARLPMDCGLHEAAAYITRRMAMWPREDINALVNKMDSFTQAATVGDAAVAEVIEDMTNMNFGVKETKVKGRRTRVK
jgi:hypothetical protein